MQCMASAAATMLQYSFEVALSLKLLSLTQTLLSCSRHVYPSRKDAIRCTKLKFLRTRLLNTRGDVHPTFRVQFHAMEHVLYAYIKGAVCSQTAR